MQEMSEAETEGTNTTDIPLSKPSVFEIVAHESVAAVFRPAFHYVARLLGQKYPDKLRTFLKYADEIYMLGDLVLQRHYLNYYNALLSENFYYLKRVDVSGGSARKLSQKLQYLSLFVHVILSYAKVKLDRLFESLRDRTIRQEDGSISGNNNIVNFFLKIYPYIHFALQCPFAIYQFGYILNLISYHSPVFHALKVQLARASSEDLTGPPLQLLSSSSPFYQKILNLPSLVVDKTIKLVAVTMPAVIFFLQFVEWWYSAEHEMTSSVNKLPIPPPPQAPKTSEHGCGLPPHPLQCPLCQNVHRNMAALVSSGFVFCYPCIHEYVAKHGLCPVTRIPSSLDQILRIYSLQST